MRVFGVMVWVTEVKLGLEMEGTGNWNKSAAEERDRTAF